MGDESPKDRPKDPGSPPDKPADAPELDDEEKQLKEKLTGPHSPYDYPPPGSPKELFTQYDGLKKGQIEMRALDKEDKAGAGPDVQKRIKLFLRVHSKEVKDYDKALAAARDRGAGLLDKDETLPLEDRPPLRRMLQGDVLTTVPNNADQSLKDLFKAAVKTYGEAWQDLHLFIQGTEGAALVSR